MAASLGLREKTKLRRRGDILKAAEKLFHTAGYQAASIEQIADIAEVSIGTIYTYFGSKGGIMRELLLPVIQHMTDLGREVVAHPPGDPADAIIALFDAYRFDDDWKGRDIMSAFDPRAERKDERIQELSDNFEAALRPQMVELVTALQQRKIMNPELSADDMGFLLYATLKAHFETYLSSDGDLTYEDLLAIMHRRIRQMAVSWSAA